MRVLVIGDHNNVHLTKINIKLGQQQQRQKGHFFRLKHFSKKHGVGDPKFPACLPKQTIRQRVCGAHRTRVQTIRINLKKRRGYLDFSAVNVQRQDCLCKYLVSVKNRLLTFIKCDLILVLRSQFFEFFAQLFLQTCLQSAYLGAIRLENK